MRRNGCPKVCVWRARFFSGPLRFALKTLENLRHNGEMLLSTFAFWTTVSPHDVCSAPLAHPHNEQSGERLFCEVMLYRCTEIETANHLAFSLAFPGLLTKLAFESIVAQTCTIMMSGIESVYSSFGKNYLPMSYS